MLLINIKSPKSFTGLIHLPTLNDGQIKSEIVNIVVYFVFYLQKTDFLGNVAVRQVPFDSKLLNLLILTFFFNSKINFE